MDYILWSLPFFCQEGDYSGSAEKAMEYGAQKTPALKPAFFVHRCGSELLDKMLRVGRVYSRMRDPYPGDSVRTLRKGLLRVIRLSRSDSSRCPSRAYRKAM